MKAACNVATLIERYFTERLMRQRNVSANTIASYRDTFRLLFTFAQARLHKSPSALSLDDLDAPFIGVFLTDLETRRGAGVRTRNLRLTAIRSFFRFLSFEEPAHSALIQRVLAIPSKRHDKRQVHFLTRPEIEAILAAPDRTTWLGRRDHALLLLAAQTGLRLSELIGLDRDAVHLGAGAHVRCVGKGRKERCTPLTTHARCALQAWLKEPARRERLVPQRACGAAQRRQRPGAARQACAGRQPEVPVIDVQAGITARVEAQRGDGAAAGGCRLLRDRAVAWS
jgi:site-specific recombinase XerD